MLRINFGTIAKAQATAAQNVGKQVAVLTETSAKGTADALASLSDGITDLVTNLQGPPKPVVAKLKQDVQDVHKDENHISWLMDKLGESQKASADSIQRALAILLMNTSPEAQNEAVQAAEAAAEEKRLLQAERDEEVRAREEEHAVILQLAAQNEAAALQKEAEEEAARLQQEAESAVATLMEKAKQLGFAEGSDGWQQTETDIKRLRGIAETGVQKVLATALARGSKLREEARVAATELKAWAEQEEQARRAERVEKIQSQAISEGQMLLSFAEAEAQRLMVDAEAEAEKVRQISILDNQRHEEEVENARKLKEAQSELDRCHHSVARSCAVHHVPCAVHFVSCTVHRAPCSVHCAPCSVLRAPCTMYHAPCSVLRAPCSVPRAPCTLCCAPCAVHHVA